MIAKSLKLENSMGYFLVGLQLFIKILPMEMHQHLR
jgi:hypothetical protein